MQDLTVSVVQSKQIWEDKQANFEHFQNLIDQQLQDSTDVIVFPEMFHTGFSMNVKLLAEEMSNSLGVKWLKRLAASRNSLCLASLIVVENGRYFNRMVAVFPDGNVEHYDKNHLFSLAKEDEHYSAGAKRTIVSFRDWKLLLQVCYDLRFPENSRNSVNESGEFAFDAIVYVANWPQRRISHWDKLIPARAIENQCFVLAVNRVGVDANELTYSGSTQIVNGLGEYTIEPIQDIETIETAVLSKELLQDIRGKLPFLKDRRPEIKF